MLDYGRISTTFDILTCDAIHAVDTLRWLGGEIKKISSDIEKFYAEYNNAFNALLKFENGTIGFLLTNWAAGKRIFSVEMHAKGISAFVEPDNKTVIYKDNKEEGEIFSTQKAKQALPLQNSYFIHHKGRRKIEKEKSHGYKEEIATTNQES